MKGHPVKATEVADEATARRQILQRRVDAAFLLNPTGTTALLWRARPWTDEREGFSVLENGKSFAITATGRRTSKWGFRPVLLPGSSVVIWDTRNGQRSAERLPGAEGAT
jgi:hypothetical protein